MSRKGTNSGGAKDYRRHDVDETHGEGWWLNTTVTTLRFVRDTDNEVSELGDEFLLQVLAMQIIYTCNGDRNLAPLPLFHPITELSSIPKASKVLKSSFCMRHLFRGQILESAAN